MRSLVIGAAGFVGQYLIRQLLESSDPEVHATHFGEDHQPEAGTTWHELDVRDASAVQQLVSEIDPDAIFHLAALSSVAVSWQKPALAIDINVIGALNVLDAVRNSKQEPRVLLIGSSEEYGFTGEDSSELGEESPLRPGNIYAITKVTQNMLGAVYARAYGVQAIMVRAFNHIGPGQLDQFVVSDFCHQIARIEAGLQAPIMRVGNIAVERDFSDVRDIVRAYELLVRRGQIGETYNVGSGRAIAIREILDRLLALSDSQIQVLVDQDKYRPADIPSTRADITKLRAATGWEPIHSLDKTLQDVLDWWRVRVAQA